MFAQSLSIRCIRDFCWQVLRERLLCWDGSTEPFAGPSSHFQPGGVFSPHLWFLYTVTSHYKVTTSQLGVSQKTGPSLGLSTMLWELGTKGTWEKSHRFFRGVLKSVPASAGNLCPLALANTRESLYAKPGSYVTTMGIKKVGLSETCLQVGVKKGACGLKSLLTSDDTDEHPVFLS